jgi:hypothetical protein
VGDSLVTRRLNKHVCITDEAVTTISSPRALRLIRVYLKITEHTEGGQNSGNTKKLKYRFVLVTLKELQFATLNVLFSLRSVRVSSSVIVLSDSSCGRIGKRETCPILKEERLLVRV